MLEGGEFQLLLMEKSLARSASVAAARRKMDKWRVRAPPQEVRAQCRAMNLTRLALSCNHAKRLIGFEHGGAAYAHYRPHYPSELSRLSGP